MKLNRSRRPRWGGTTAYMLVEALVAVALVGTMVVSLYSCITISFALVQQTRENLRATQILLQRMETIRLYKWSQVNDTKNYLFPTFTEVYDPNPSGGTNSTSGAVYSGTVSVTPPTGLPAAYQTNMRLVTVTISWTNCTWGKPLAHRRQMQTYVARYGIQNYVLGGHL